VNRRYIYVTPHTVPDDLGRQRFTVEWWAPNFYLGPAWRSQVFFANVTATTKQWKRPVRFWELTHVSA
jgi:hypothetical protein